MSAAGMAQVVSADRRVLHDALRETETERERERERLVTRTVKHIHI